MKVLVTGGAGFIGSHIAERLLREGHRVAILDNFTSGRRENIAAFAQDLEVIEADVRDAPQLEWHMAGCEVVFHQAAIVSVPYSVEHPQETHDVNLQGTLNVVQAARRRGVKRVVFASSAAIYGEEPGLPKVETMAPAPVSPYGVEKITGEYYLQTYARLFGLETVALRYFNVFGPRQDPSSAYSGVISIFVDRALRGAPVTTFGDGEQYRDFVYIDNVVDMNLRAATMPNVAGRVFNVGCGAKTSLNDLARALGEIVGKPLEVRREPPRAGDIRESVAAIERARAELGYEPRVDVVEGLRRLVAFERSRRA
jgi:UDP-glucose 4-epimerase